MIGDGEKERDINVSDFEKDYFWENQTGKRETEREKKRHRQTERKRDQI